MFLTYTAILSCAPKPIILKNYIPAPMGKVGTDSSDCLNMSPEACQAFELVNNIRANHSLPKLVALENCINSATSHSEQMAADQKLSHDNSKITWIERIKKHGATGEAMAENIGISSAAQKMTEQWMSSDYHKKNILSNKFSHTGLAFTSRYWTQCFVEKI